VLSVLCRITDSDYPFFQQVIDNLNNQHTKSLKISKKEIRR